MQANATAPSGSPQLAQQCNICLEDELNSTTIKVLDVCKHVFHTECVEKWFKTQEEAYRDSTCPVCRRIVRPLSDEKKEERARELESQEGDLQDFYTLALLMSSIASRNRQLNLPAPPGTHPQPIELPLFLFPLNLFFRGVFDLPDSEDEEEDLDNAQSPDSTTESQPSIRNVPLVQPEPAPSASRKRSMDDPDPASDPKRKTGEDGKGK